MLIICGVVGLLMSEDLDFSAVLLVISVVTGIIWLLDVALLRRFRAQAARTNGKNLADIPEPGTVDYARSFFPVALTVLVLRAFIFEPFRIPSDSMMPTLLDGDFIIVNKFAYGLRLPVINRKIVPIGTPQRGDVVVFRYPPNPSVNYIKRLVGLPGDQVQVKDDKLIVNGAPVPATDLGLYGDGCYEGMHKSSEHLGTHTHQIHVLSDPRRYRCRAVTHLHTLPAPQLCLCGGADRRHARPGRHGRTTGGATGQLSDDWGQPR